MYMQPEKWFVGLDIATTTGIAIYIPSKNVAAVGLSKGLPGHQLDEIISMTIPLPKEFFHLNYVLEEPHHLRNAKTALSLISRYGYLKYSLMGLGYGVSEVNLNSARAWLGTKDKQGTHLFFTEYFVGSYLTSDHTDALAVALYEANLRGKTPFDTYGFMIYQMPKEGVNAISR